MDKRSEYVEKMSAEMVEWDFKISQLEDSAERATPSLKLELSSAIALLQLKREEAAKKLMGITGTSDAEWEDLKAGTDQVWDEVKSILHEAIMKTV